MLIYHADVTRLGKSRRNGHTETGQTRDTQVDFEPKKSCIALPSAKMRCKDYSQTQNDQVYHHFCPTSRSYIKAISTHFPARALCKTNANAVRRNKVYISRNQVSFEAREDTTSHSAPWISISRNPSRVGSVSTYTVVLKRQQSLPH